MGVVYEEMFVEKVYPTLSRQQREFMRTGVWEKVCIVERGVGKTYAHVLRALCVAIAQDKATCIVKVKNSSHLAHACNLFREQAKNLGVSFRWRSSAHRFELGNGSSVWLLLPSREDLTQGLSNLHIFDDAATD